MSFSTAAGLPGTHSPQWSPHTTPVGQTHTQTPGQQAIPDEPESGIKLTGGGAFFMWEKIM